LLARTVNLTNVSLSSNGLRKNFAEVLSLAIDPRRAYFKSQIKVLDLSKNQIDKDGIKALA
jgi:Ran GTPase-activating protein (RanGAP) involved in mRNA processing and transport